MSKSIDEMDQSQFVCFQLKDQSVYFGEVIYIDQEGKEFDPKSDPDAQNKGKPVRHGFGVQLFGTTKDNFLCQYEGQWDHDKKSGSCKCYYPDQAIYVGEMQNDVKEGFGRFTWSNEDFYQGNWRNNRFQGGGTFSHHDGHSLQGYFKNNYFVKNNDTFINPFLSEEEIENFIQRRNQINNLKEKNQKLKLFFFEKTNNIEQLAELINRSNRNNRVPLILSSTEGGARMHQVFDSLISKQKRKYHEFDLRKVDTLKATNKSKEYIQKTKVNLSNAISKGDIFIINLDQSDVVYQEIFYPDIREFYQAGAFPSQIWSMEELNRPQVFQKIITDTENHLKLEVSPKFNVVVWTKFKLSEVLENKQIIEKLERRFSSIIPIIKVDFIMVEA